MSVVANVVLMHSVSEPSRSDPPVYFAHDQIELYFQTGDNAGSIDSRRGLVACDNPDLPRGWYGGTKMLEVEVLIGAFNYLNVGAFVEHVGEVKWRYPDQVVLVVKHEHWDAPKVYRFRDNRLVET